LGRAFPRNPHPSRDLADRLHFDFKAHRVAAGCNLKRLAATLHQETSAAFPLEIFVHKKIGNGPEAASRIVRGVGARFYGVDPKMPLGVSGG
jgi:hypothetical protein